MPKLGNKKYAYTKKGKAAYKAAKKKGKKMNESTRKRLLGLMVTEGRMREGEDRGTARGAAEDRRRHSRGPNIFQKMMGWIVKQGQDPKKQRAGEEDDVENDKDIAAGAQAAQRIGGTLRGALPRGRKTIVKNVL